MAFHLVVLKTFGRYRRGDIITDRALVEKILASPEASFVVRTTAVEV